LGSTEFRARSGRTPIKRERERERKETTLGRKQRLKKETKSPYAHIFPPKIFILFFFFY
jgi:hypothetical protein